MAIIVDDTVDVWTNDLANLCVTRRFVGDQLDDGLQLLSWQLDTAHRAFFASAPSEGYSLDPAALDTPRAPPSVFSVLADTRGQILAGCTIALTGVVNGLGHEEGLENVPLGVLIRLYGGQTTMHVEQATHLVARRKDGWKASPKIRRALARLQARSIAHCRAPCPNTHAHANLRPRAHRRPRRAAPRRFCMGRHFAAPSTFHFRRSVGYGKRNAPGLREYRLCRRRSDRAATGKPSGRAALATNEPPRDLSQTL